MWDSFIQGIDASGHVVVNNRNVILAADQLPQTRRNTIEHTTTARARDTSLELGIPDLTVHPMNKCPIPHYVDLFLICHFMDKVLFVWSVHVVNFLQYSATYTVFYSTGERLRT